MNVVLSQKELIAAVKEYLYARRLVVPDDSEKILIIPQESGEYVVEVTDVSILPSPPAMVTRTEVASQRRPGMPPQRPAQLQLTAANVAASDEEFTKEEESTLLASSRQLEAKLMEERAQAAASGTGKKRPQRMSLVGATLEDLGKDPTDMSDEIG